jgi:NAD(P)-dependent dehydrogenase (short-subunit alcohol dehydrogenase family)
MDQTSVTARGQARPRHQIRVVKSRGDPAVFVDTDHPAAAMMAGTPAGRTGDPSDIAAAVAYLASDDAAFVHGTVLDVDGGRTSVAVIAG